MQQNTLADRNMLPVCQISTKAKPDGFNFLTTGRSIEKRTGKLTVRRISEKMKKKQFPTLSKKLKGDEQSCISSYESDSLSDQNLPE